MPDANTLALVLIAVMNAFTAFMAYRTHVAAVTTQTNVAKVEIATNSMKDALVKATGEASHAAGMAEGIAQGRQDTKDEAK